jgi:hypothetical protein
MITKLLSRREIIAGSAAMLVSEAIAKPAEHWPSISIKPALVAELNERFAGRWGNFHDESYPLYLQEYTPKGDYLNWGAIRDFRNDSETLLTDGGLPKVIDPLYPEPFWNPVTLSHFALMHYGRFLRGRSESRVPFFRAVDKLIELQLPNGGFPYPGRPYRKLKLADGWISGMAQGNAMSVFYRAWSIEPNLRYLKAGELAFASLMTPTRKGGPATTLADLDPSLSSYPFLAEWPTDPIDYTLNGYMFALLGLYDWSYVSRKASVAFERNIETLVRLLPFHDVDGFSTYDLSHIILKLPPYVASPYLGIHVYLLHALHSITGVATLKRYQRRWTAKIDEMNKPLRITDILSDVPSPQPVGTTITFRLQSAGGSGGQKLYQFGVRHGTEWTFPQPFSPDNTFTWTPKETDTYYIGFYAKNVESSQEFDNFRNQAFTIRERLAP